MTDSPDILYGTPAPASAERGPMEHGTLDVNADRAVVAAPPLTGTPALAADPDCTGCATLREERDTLIRLGRAVLDEVCFGLGENAYPLIPASPRTPEGRVLLALWDAVRDNQSPAAAGAEVTRD